MVVGWLVGWLVGEGVFSMNWHWLNVYVHVRLFNFCYYYFLLI